MAETRVEIHQGPHTGKHRLQHKLMMEQKVRELSGFLNLNGKKLGQSLGGTEEGKETC